ncbi:50S ribosomal protein L3 [archaeon]|nr:50S ribosomal protein L3 [archaeon]
MQLCKKQRVKTNNQKLQTKMGTHHPRRGSLQFWPRARAKSLVAKPRAFALSEEAKLHAFVGYKAGMTHLIVQEQNPTSQRKNMDIFCPATVIECPPMKIFSIRFYKKTESGLKIISEIFSQTPAKNLAGKANPSKKANVQPPLFDSISIVFYTLPSSTNLSKKTPDMLEIPLINKKELLDYALSLLNKEVKISEVFKPGQFLDVHAVTKGRGFCGVIKKFGIKKRPHKSEKKIRGIGTLGAWHPNKVLYSVAQAGKFGFHTRTEYNKQLLKIGAKPGSINPKGGFLHYGLIKSDYIIIKGSVPGPAKRPVTLITAIRQKAITAHEPIIKYTSLESKQ